jgi:hypothetical protein
MCVTLGVLCEGSIESYLFVICHIVCMHQSNKSTICYVNQTEFYFLDP